MQEQFPVASADCGISTASLSERAGVYPRHNAQSMGIGWLLWTLAATLPWLISAHFDPWTSFYSDWMAALVLLPLVGWVFLASTTKRLTVSGLVLSIAIVSVVPLLQAFSGVLIFPGEAFVFVACILLVALSVFLGQRAELADRQQLMDSLFASLILASLISTGLALYQWLALEGLGVLVPSPEIGGVRAIANIGQPNNLSTLFALGCVACWWACASRQITAWVAILAVAFFMLGIVLTGSRTGILQLIFLAIVLVCWRVPRFSVRKIGGLLLLGSWLAFLLYAVPALGDFLFGVGGREGMLSLGLREQIWSMAIEALVDAPWFGYGWNQVVVIHVAAAERYPSLGSLVGQTHNFVLDLLLWNGALVGGVLVAAMAWWGVRQVMSVRQEAHGIILAAIGVFLVHAMLELPHLYLMMLVPVGLLVGAASIYGCSMAAVTMPRYSLVLIALVLGALLAITFRDYREIEQNLVARQLFAARISGAERPEPPRLIVLGALQQAFDLLDGEPKRHMRKDQLAAVRRAVVRYPTPGGVFRYAQASALNGNFDEASWALQLLCNTRDTGVCKASLSDWGILADSGNPEMKSVVLPKVE